MESCKKFGRSTNFTAAEENILISLVKKYKNVIECKKTDTNSNKMKANAWVQLAKEYNSICAEYHRDVKTLKNKYDNIKKRTKQKFADHKRYIKGTGGGPEKDIIITNTDNDIHEIIGTQLTGLDSEFDDDVVAETIHISTSDSIEFDIIDVPASENDSLQIVELQEDADIRGQPGPSTDLKEKDDKENWAKYTPTLLKAPKATPLCNSPKKVNENRHKRGAAKFSIGYRLEEWAAGKVALTNIQQQCFLDQHNLKMQQMKEMHEQQLHLQQKEAEEKLKFLEAEHKIKMEVLRVELAAKKTTLK